MKQNLIALGANVIATGASPWQENENEIILAVLLPVISNNADKIPT